MVFSGKIYDQVKEKLDKYLFGFDRDQLNVSLLAGKFYRHSRILTSALVQVLSNLRGSI